MPPPDDPLEKINAQLRRTNEILGLSESRFNPLKRVAGLGALGELPDHLRKSIEGHGALTAQLDAIRHAIRPFNLPVLPDSVRLLIEGPSSLSGYLDKLKEASAAYGRFATPAMLRWVTDAQHPYAGQLEALKRATEIAGPMQAALHTAFGEANAYTRHLDAVRSAAALTSVSGLQDALHRTAAGLPKWMRPPASADMLLPSWKLTAGLGAFGVAQPGLIQDVLRALHRERPDTFAFDISVKLNETFDQADDLGTEQTVDILQKYTEALVDLLVSTKDWVVKQGVANMLLLIMAAASLYYAREAYLEGHLGRLDADEQTVLARAAASAEPTPAQQEIARHVQSLETAIRAQDVRHQAERNSRVVVQSAPLRLAPDAKASAIRVVYPEDRVRLLDVKRGWALVEVFEYKSETMVTGWINRRVLRLPAAGE